MDGEDGVGGECSGRVGAGYYSDFLEVVGGEESFEDLGADCAACLVRVSVWDVYSSQGGLKSLRPRERCSGCGSCRPLS